MKRFKRLDETGLQDWDERPDGPGFTIRPPFLPDFRRPPTIIVVGKSRKGIIFAPPLNWFDWGPKYPVMTKEVFKRYHPCQHEPKVLYRHCPDCGRNTVLKTVCLFCLYTLERGQKKEYMEKVLA